MGEANSSYCSLDQYFNAKIRRGTRFRSLGEKSIKSETESGKENKHKEEPTQEISSVDFDELSERAKNTSSFE